MVVIKWADAIKWQRVKVDSPQCGGLYKEDHGSIIPWSGTDPDTKINSLTWYTDDNYSIFLADQYNGELNNWKGPINNGQFHSQTIQDIRKTEEICSKYAGSVKFNGIPREGNPEIPINSYKDQFCEHMVRN